MRYPETPSAERTMEAEDPPRPPRSSPPPSSSSAMCEIVTNFEVLPLIFSLCRNRSPADEPRGSMPTAASSGSSSQDTEDLQAIKLKV